MKAETAEMGSAPSEVDPPSDTPRAPRHGLNAKALLMQAAVLAAEEAANIEDTIPETLSAQKQQIAHLKSAFASSSKLLTGIPRRETPVVAFVNHTKVSQAHFIVAPGNISTSPWPVNFTDQLGIVQRRSLESHGSRSCRS